MPPIINPSTIACCSTCCCLGYRRVEVPTRLKVLSDRSYEDFESSADQKGCPHCSVILQSFALFDKVVPNMQVDLLLYADSPTEMHTKPEEGQSEVLELYPCQGKHFLNCSMVLIILTEVRRLDRDRVIMVRSSQGCAANSHSTGIDTIPTECIPNMHF
jgi:hypothetical protein